MFACVHTYIYIQFNLILDIMHLLVFMFISVRWSVLIRISSGVDVMFRDASAPFFDAHGFGFKAADLAHIFRSKLVSNYKN